MWSTCSLEFWQEKNASWPASSTGKTRLHEEAEHSFCYVFNKGKEALCWLHISTIWSEYFSTVTKLKWFSQRLCHVHLVRPLGGDISILLLSLQQVFLAGTKKQMQGQRWSQVPYSWRVSAFSHGSSVLHLQVPIIMWQKDKVPIMTSCQREGGEDFQISAAASLAKVWDTTSLASRLHFSDKQSNWITLLLHLNLNIVVLRNYIAMSSPVFFPIVLLFRFRLCKSFEPFRYL